MKNKKLLYILLGITIIGIILYFLFRKKEGETSIFSNISDSISDFVSGENKVNPYYECFGKTRDWLRDALPLEEDIHAFETPECLKLAMDKTCGSESWKCRKLVKAGGYVPLDYVRKFDKGITDERLLSWAYELYYLSGKDWADRNDRYKLLNEAEYQYFISK